jgi:hypothetical protein
MPHISFETFLEAPETFQPLIHYIFVLSNPVQGGIHKATWGLTSKMARDGQLQSHCSLYICMYYPASQPKLHIYPHFFFFFKEMVSVGLLSLDPKLVMIKNLKERNDTRNCLSWHICTVDSCWMCIQRCGSDPFKSGSKRK